MSKFTIVGDPHAKPGNLDLINKLFDIVEDFGNNAIWLGDFLDTKEVIRGKCLNLLYRRLSESKLQHYILVGNHDWFNLDCQDHSLEILKELPNVVIIDTPQTFEFGHCIPYIHDQDELKKVLKNLSKDKPLFAHLEIKGFDFGNGHICDHGITTRSLSKFPLVVSGHFHKFQNKGNLVYLGTPFSHSFGETNQDKWLAIFDSEKKDLNNENEPHLCMGMETISMNGIFPGHSTVTIDCNDPNPAMHGYYEHDHIRFIYEGTKENIEKAKIKYPAPVGAKVIERPTDSMVNNLVIDETLDNTVKFKNWAKDIKGLDLETIDLGAAILEKCR